MAHFLLRKLLMLLATLLSVSLIVFLALELNIEDVAINVLGPYSAADQRAAEIRRDGLERREFACREGGLSRAGQTNNADPLTRANMQVEVAENRRARVITEVDVTKLNHTFIDNG